MVKDLIDNETFSGFVSAVFEGGVATSVVVWDQTPDIINAGGDIGPGGRYMDNKSTVAEINEALQDGNVIIKDSWSPTRVAGEVRKLNIPRGRTLTIEKDFDAVYEDVAVHLEDGVGVGTLNVGGTYTMAYDTTDTINYNIVANDMRILREGGRLNGTIQPYGVTIASTVKVTNDLAIQNATAQTPSVVYELKVARGADVAVGGDVVSMVFSTGAVDTANPNDVWVWIDGHMEVDGSMVPHSYVTYPSSLIVGDEMIGTLILNNGKATIGTMTGDIKLQNANDQLIITDEISGDFLQIAKDAQVTLEKNALVTGNAAKALGLTAGSVDAAATLKASANAGSANNATPIESDTFEPATAGGGDPTTSVSKVNLTLPVGYKYAWAADSANGLWEEQDETAATDDPIEVPKGATVTVKVPDTVDTWYVESPVAAGTYLAAGDTYEIAAISADTDHSESFGDKYYKVSADAKANAGAVDGITFSYDALAAVYKKATETVTITLKGSNDTVTAGEADVFLAATSVGSTGLTVSPAKVTTPAAESKWTTADNKTLTITLGTPSAKDIPIVIAASDTEA